MLKKITMRHIRNDNYKNKKHKFENTYTNKILKD